ncbi:MAG: GDP-mannose 4,6-dehydratase [Candidatus Margulisiibacteriota bacterium]
MTKYLVTGFSGFVSQHFIAYLAGQGEQAEVLGVDIAPPDPAFAGYPGLKIEYAPLDLLNNAGLRELLARFRPDRILHLASFSSVAFSWQNPILSFQHNTNIFLNLVEQVHKLGLDCRIISVGSSDEYGQVAENELPLTEESPLRPASPYAVARVSQEMLSRLFVDGYGLDIIMTRSFNHIGPGQRETFVVASFAKQLVEAKKRGLHKCELVTGDLDVVRDFCDVRDVVRAYHGLFRQGTKGQLYNICSAQGHSLRDLVALLAELLGIEVVTKVDRALIRPNEIKMIVGANQKIAKETGWRPQYDLRRSLRDILDYWSAK